MTGTKTLPTAIDAPMTRVPIHSPAAPVEERATLLTASTTSEISTVRSIPKRRDARWTSGDAAAKASSGSAARRPWAASPSPSSAPIRGRTGPTAVSAGRKHRATRKTVAVMAAAQRPRLDIDARPAAQYGSEEGKGRGQERDDDEGDGEVAGLGDAADDRRGDQAGGVGDGGDARDGLGGVRSAAGRCHESQRDDDRDPDADQSEPGHRARRVRREHDQDAAEHRDHAAQPHGPYGAEPVYVRIAGEPCHGHRLSEPGRRARGDTR